LPTSKAVIERSYGCTFGCGNPYDFVFISVRDGTTEFLCLPCFVHLASDMVKAVTEPSADEKAAWSDDELTGQGAPMLTGGSRGRGKNAPATSDDPGLLEAFDSVITEEDLPEVFR